MPKRGVANNKSSIRPQEQVQTMRTFHTRVHRSHMGSSFGNPLCCVIVSRSRFQRSPFVVHWYGFDRAVPLKGHPVNGRAMTVRREMGFKRRIGRDSGRAKCVTTSCWLKLLSSMAGRSGTANSAPKPACRQGISAGDPKPTFHRDGMEGSPQEMGAVGRLCRLRVMEKTMCWRAKPSGQTKTKLWEFRNKLNMIRNSERGHQCSWRTPMRRQRRVRTARWR